ncbi:MAG: DsbA family protein, partial [Candidatus Puniceispirillaceae bacterium]
MMSLTSPVQADLTSVDKAKLDEMIRTYIEENPGVIRDALQQLAEREEREQKLAALAFLEMSEGDPVLGNPDGSLVIYEFSDYNCGYCKRVFVALRQLIEEDDDIKLVIKEFPILSQSSLLAAQAAIAAQAQGVFPAFHVAMMTSRGAVTMDSIMSAAGDAGADLDRLQRDMTSAEVAMIIERTRAAAQQLDISGTPGLVIGREVIPGAIDIDQMRQ